MIRAITALALVIPALAQHAERASELIQHGDLKSAEMELRKAVDESPDDPALLTSLGGVLGMEGDLKQANTYLAKAVKLRPGDPLPRRNLAANEWQLGRFREAHENLERLIRADPKDKTAIFLLGMVCENEKDYPRSIALLESIPDVTERRPEAVVALASSYYHVGRRGDGQSTLSSILNHDVSPQVAFMAGRVAMDAGDYTLAERFFSGVQTTYSDPAAVKFQLALAQYRQDRRPDCEKTLRSAIEAKQANPEAYVLFCKLLAERGAYAEALQYVTEAARAYPQSSEVFSAKAALEMKLQYFSAAVDSLRRASLLSPSADIRRDLALAEWRAGNRAGATADFEDALRRFPRDAEALQMYGTLLLEDGSPDAKVRAIELFKKAIAVDKSAVEALYNLGNLALADGNLRSAEEYLEAAIKSDPGQSRSHFALSRVYRRQGRTADADLEMQQYQKLKAAEQGQKNLDRASSR
jgi:Flp pilus assembly protein TadD